MARSKKPRPVLIPLTVLREWRRHRASDGSPLREGERCMNHLELGRLIGRSAFLVKKVEEGQRRLTLELAIALSRVTGMPLQQIARPEDLHLVEEAAPMLGFRRRDRSRTRSSRKGSPGGNGTGPKLAAGAGVPQ